MNEQEKKKYLDEYKKEKEKGVPFFPDIIFKDTIASLLIFIILVALAYFVGAPLEARANPADTTYTPRPEWYFLFLFQALKYFPGNLEVVGAMVLPGLFIILLILLPFIDKSPKRYFLNRPFASISALVVVAGIGFLTITSVREAPAPQEAVVVDKAAALYATNCANCHGPSIDIPAGTDLHQIIAAGTHEGMPAWGGDLSTDEIDTLAGFILSPNGSALFTQYCAVCHKQPLAASGNPVELQRVFDEGVNYPPHKSIETANWDTSLTETEINALLNFLAAPDGQRLFVVNCSGCHGQGVGYNGTEEDLAKLIKKGGQHLDMPAWKGTLSEKDMDTLASYVVDPQQTSGGVTLFGQHCASCHGDKVPKAPDKASALKIISSGGAHLTMPVWGDILTAEQLDALVKYTFEASKGGGPAAGANLFAENCSACHGASGQGGLNPTRHGDTIAPISSSDFLKTRDDATIRKIIAYGQPDFGMSPFGAENGGPFDDAQLDAVVAFIRNWEANPPATEAPAENVDAQQTPTPATLSPNLTSLTGEQLFAIACARCHGPAGVGDIGPAFNTKEFQDGRDDQALFDMINFSRVGTPMIAWSDKLSKEQIELLVHYIRTLGPDYAASLTYSGKVKSIFESNCQVCHNSSTARGGWDSTSYQSIMTSGNNGPVIVPGNAADSLLAQSILGQGSQMPPIGSLSQSDIQVILDWIAAGAPEN
ncbi:MAG: c-type cytochrome [Anaerolineales bacterium]